MILYNLYLGNYQIVVLIISIYVCLYLNIVNEENIKNKFNIKKYCSNNISQKLNEFYQDIFNISVNSATTTINNFNVDFINDIQKIYSERKFIFNYDNSCKITTITFCFIILSLLKFDKISSIELMITIKYIMYSLNDFILSKQRLHSYINYVYEMMKIYSLEQRELYPQFKIENNQTIAINKLIININKDIELKINKSIILEPYQLYLIVGKSGSGKTTLVKTLRSINYINPINAGIYIDNDKYNLHNISSNIYYVDQFTRLYKNGNIYQIINGFDDSYSDNESNIIIDELIKMSGLNDLKDDIIDLNKISGGQMYRLSICKTLFQSNIQNKRIIIMDEIDAALDILTTKKILTYIKSSLKNSTILYISHKEQIKDLNFPIIQINDGIISLQNSCEQSDD
jgi:peptide/nickel transport system ATP-binding protein